MEYGNSILPNLSAQCLIATWEAGDGLNLVQRMLILLANSLTMSIDEVAKFSLGVRNIYIFKLREQLFGKRIGCLLNCLFCHQSMEFSLFTDVLCPLDIMVDKDTVLLKNITIGKYVICFRLLNSNDLLACSGYTDINKISAALLQQSIVQITYEGKDVIFHELPESILKEFSRYMQDIEPQAEILLHLSCPHCGENEEILFDIASFIWQEISKQAQLLLYEIHQLAKVYGWSEIDILNMPAKRKQIYLNWII